MEGKTIIMLGALLLALIILIRELRGKGKAQVVVLGLLLLVSFSLGSGGCSLWNAFKPTSLVKHPDSPMLVQKAKSGYLRIAVYDSIENKMFDYGWIEIKDLEGWTLRKFDWQAFIEKQKREREDNN